MTIKDFLIETANILWGGNAQRPLNAGEVILHTLAAALTNKLMGMPISKKAQQICSLQTPDGLTPEIIDNSIELELCGTLLVYDKGEINTYAPVSMRIFKLINEINK